MSRFLTNTSEYDRARHQLGVVVGRERNLAAVGGDRRLQRAGGVLEAVGGCVDADRPAAGAELGREDVLDFVGVVGDQVLGVERKATVVPSAEITGWSESPAAGSPDDVVLTIRVFLALRS